MASAAAEFSGKGAVRSAVRGAGRRGLQLFRLLRCSLTAFVDHNGPTVAQATAYSAIISLFPALIVAAAIFSLLPEALPLRVQIALFLDRILPSNVSPLFVAYFASMHKTPQTTRALLAAIGLSLTGAANVMATLMEGFRRAHELPLLKADFWSRRVRALLLVPLSLIPMTVATTLVVFGSHISKWLAGEVAPDMRMPVLVIALVLRWTMALAGSVGILAVVYHLGTDLETQRQNSRQRWLELRKVRDWRHSLPGAVVATLLWFVSTLLFGFYVTRFANYSRVYGSLGAVIALMFWLYLIAMSVLAGAEFNAQVAEGRTRLKLRSQELADGVG